MIERLFAGGRVESPAGTLDLPPFPASAAGPDLREAILGSEGRLGILTEATVRISALPEAEEFHGVFLPDLPSALDATRELAQARLPLSMVRLATPDETRTTLLLAGHDRLPRRRAESNFLSFVIQSAPAEWNGGLLVSGVNCLQ